MDKLLINFSKNINIKKIGFAKIIKLEKNTNELIKWINNGYVGNMNFLNNNIDKRKNPKLLLKNAKTIITIAEPYPNNIQYNSKLKIAKYATIEDYHIRIYNKLLKLSNFIKENFNKTSYISVDTNPVFEKEWAVQCGIGWQGKNSLIISEEFGSYFNIGILITDLECNIKENKKIENKCGNCNLCIKNCPTNAIVSDKIINATKCISYLTNETKLKDEILEKKEIAKTGYILGCDICQDVCPYNKKIQTNLSCQSNIDENIKEVLYNTNTILSMSNKTFEKKFEKYTLKRLRLNRLKRNINIINN